MRRNFRKAKGHGRNCGHCNHYEWIKRYGKMVQLCLDPTCRITEWRLATTDSICDNFSSNIILRGARQIRKL